MSTDLILHVLDHALPELSGYSVRTHNILRALHRGGLPVLAVAPALDGTLRERTLDGVPYVDLPVRSSSLASLPRMLGLFGDLRRQLRDRRVSLIHAHTPVRCGVPAYGAARAAGVPVVYELRGLWEETAVDRDRMHPRSLRFALSRGLETWLMRRVDTLATISHGLMDDARERGVAAPRIVHVPNGVDCRAFQPESPDTELLERHRLSGAFVVGFIGTFYAYEGVDYLLEAFAQLYARRPDARLLLVGDGEMGDALRASIQRLQIASAVIMPGSVPHREVHRYYSLCDVLVYPRRRTRSTELTTPLRPLEAMAMQRAVLASDLPAMRELIRNGETGLLATADDAVSLATALEQLAGDDASRRRLAANGRRMVLESRDWNRLWATYAALYERLLGRPVVTNGAGA